MTTRMSTRMVSTYEVACIAGGMRGGYGILVRVLYCLAVLGSLRYRDYGLRTTAGRALSFVCSTGLSRANIER